MTDREQEILIHEHNAQHARLRGDFDAARRLDARARRLREEAAK